MLRQLVIEALRNIGSSRTCRSSVLNFPGTAAGNAFVLTCTSNDAVDALVYLAVVLAIPVREYLVAIDIAEGAITLTDVAPVSCEKSEETYGGTTVQRARALLIETYSHDIAMSLGDLFAHFDRLSDNFPSRMNGNRS